MEGSIEEEELNRKESFSMLGGMRCSDKCDYFSIMIEIQIIRFPINPKLSFMYFRVDPEIDESRWNPVPEQIGAQEHCEWKLLLKVIYFRIIC